MTVRDPDRLQGVYRAFLAEINSSRVLCRRLSSVVLRTLLLVGVVGSAAGIGAPGAGNAPHEPIGAITRLASKAGIWLSASEVRALPTKGSAWKQVKTAADAALGPANIADEASDHDVNTLAVALVSVRTGQRKYATKATQAIMSAIGTEDGGSSLALARNLVSYVVAADLVGLSGTNAESFTTWLRGVIGERMSDGKSLRETHERRPNNWGTHAGASRAAAAVFLGDSAELSATARVFKGFLGDRSSWNGFAFGETWWQCDVAAPVAVNPVGCTRDGHSIDGVLPDDQRRGGAFTWPPPQENYVYGALQGAVVQAEILHRAGYPAWEWESRALLRSFRWLHDQAGFPAQGDDQWQPWLVNRRFTTRFPVTTPARSGKNMGWTDWTHAR